MVRQQKRAVERKETCHISCYAPSAHEVFLTGSFNDWQTDALAMTKQTDGSWNVDVELAPGRYEFKFVVDGISCCDPHLHNDGLHCDSCAPHSCGALNRILLVR